MCDKTVWLYSRFYSFSSGCFCLEGLAPNRKCQYFILFYFIIFFPELSCVLGPNPDGEVVRLDLRRGGVVYSKYVDEKQQRRPSWVLDLKSPRFCREAEAIVAEQLWCGRESSVVGQSGPNTCRLCTQDAPLITGEVKSSYSLIKTQHRPNYKRLLGAFANCCS